MAPWDSPRRVTLAAAQCAVVERPEWRPFARASALLAAVAIAAATGTLRVFCLAYALTPLILVWIEASSRATYSIDSNYFVLTRSASYASVRALAQLAADRGAIAPRVARLAPFALASLETLGMRVVGTDSYTFGVAGREFAVYATIKSAVFLALPELEQALLHA